MRQLKRCMIVTVALGLGVGVGPVMGAEPAQAVDGGDVENAKSSQVQIFALAPAEVPEQDVDEDDLMDVDDTEELRDIEVIPAFRCSGTLISERWVLTSKRCVTGEIGQVELTKDNARVLVGSPALGGTDGQGKLIDVEEIVRNDNFDAALIELGDDIDEDTAPTAGYNEDTANAPPTQRRVNGRKVANEFTFSGWAGPGDDSVVDVAQRATQRYPADVARRSNPQFFAQVFSRGGDNIRLVDIGRGGSYTKDSGAGVFNEQQNPERNIIYGLVTKSVDGRPSGSGRSMDQTGGSFVLSTAVIADWIEDKSDVESAS